MSPHSAEDDEEFYESIDRILSSSCSSTSASDDDTPLPHRRLRFPPASAASLDVWLAEPLPVADRRLRLLRHLGLSSDTSLSRLPTSPSRSASSDNLRPHPFSSAAIPRSRSDSSSHDPGKPPLSISRPPSRTNIDDLSNENDDDDIRRRTIRSLDTGREFVVKDFREDGVCDKLRDVATGRQLTIEEFEMCVGRSPIVQELMRRQTVSDSGDGTSLSGNQERAGNDVVSGLKKSGGWIRSIKNTVVGGRGGGRRRERRSSVEWDTSSEKGGRRSSSATDDSQDGPNLLHDCPHRTKVRHYSKSQKELTRLYMSQEIQAHSGAIWSIKFSLDGRYLASAGEDRIIHVWQVTEQDRKGEPVGEENGNRNSFSAAVSNRSQEPAGVLACVEDNHWEKRRAKLAGGRKSISSDQLMAPEHVFTLSEKPVCSFRGHLDDVLDLSWSESQYLLSSSMDKTVRLWHMSCKSCLKSFSHSDYVTCIQFNPVDDRFFISGSLDEKVRIWSIPDRQVVDWNDLHEMVTAVCYTPDGQGALVGSHKGSCHLYRTSGTKLHQKSQIDLQNKKRKSSSKKITGFQFVPGSSSEVLVTSADSRIRVVDGVELVHKFKGFRNTSSQISASLTANGKYMICASEDSHVYVWRYDADSRPGRRKGAVTITQSYEYFHCQNVTVAVPWPGTGMGGMLGAQNIKQNGTDGVSNSDAPLLPDATGYGLMNFDRQKHGSVSEAKKYSDRVSATWPEEKLLMRAKKHNPHSNGDLSNGGMPAQSRSAWGMVIVTAGRGGEIRTFQNFGIPV